uniref:high mobility group B protein 15-like n=1 Tax=Erigeron canadensis TaxID=72917 RepID=UPI001CB8C21E|nr:high mobility group B protein 15-like [Erigeron canadensis]
MAKCSTMENRTLFHVEANKTQYHMYPPPVVRYEDVTADSKLFMDTLGNFHAAMGTKFMIPIIGGKDLNLHRLFVEVTSLGGIKKVLEEKKWREVTNSFNFPPSATNASFILRKYYMSLIYHFEQVYYFKAKAWTPVSNDTWQNTKHSLTSTSGINKTQLPLPKSQVLSAETQALSMKRQKTSIEDVLPKGSPKPSTGLPVTGVIDGKFDNGYLCTIMIGGEPLQGVLFQSTAYISYQPPTHQNVATECPVTSGNETQPLTMVKRRRRKKLEMKKRDPAHPKTNRSGYNFFFAEQHARLKPLHPGKDRDISRMIGELWNNITESQKAVYQEKAMKDKERYKIEMELYRKGLSRAGHIISNAAPFLQHPLNETPESDD